MEGMRNYGRDEKLRKEWEIMGGMRNYGSNEELWKEWVIMGGMRNYERNEKLWEEWEINLAEKNYNKKYVELMYLVNLCSMVSKTEDIYSLYFIKH